MFKGFSLPLKTLTCSRRNKQMIKLMDKKPAATRPLADIRANLVVAMRNRKSQEMERAYLEALSIKLPPTLNQIELGKVQGESQRDRLFRLQGDALERDAAEKAKVLVHIDHIEPKWRAATLAAREFLMRQPAPLASRLQGMGRRQVEDELRGAFEGFLRRLAAWRHGDAAHDDEAADA